MNDYEVAIVNSFLEEGIEGYLMRIEADLIEAKVKLETDPSDETATEDLEFLTQLYRDAARIADEASHS